MRHQDMYGTLHSMAFLALSIGLPIISISWVDSMVHQSGTDKETKVTITITTTRVGYISAELPNRSQRSLIRVQYRGIYSTIRVRAHGHKQKRRPKVTSQRFLPGYLLEQNLEKQKKNAGLNARSMWYLIISSPTGPTSQSVIMSCTVSLPSSYSVVTQDERLT